MKIATLCCNFQNGGKIVENLTNIINDDEYFKFLNEIKKDIISTRRKVLSQANNEVILMYYRIGKGLIKNSKYGNNFIDTLAKDLKISLADIAYIGDDINDVEVLQAVGFSGVPCSAPWFLHNLSSVPLNKKGGEGVFREFVEKLLIDTHCLDDIFSLYRFSDGEV